MRLTSAFSMRDNVERLTALLSARSFKDQLRAIRTCLIRSASQLFSAIANNPVYESMSRKWVSQAKP